MSQKVVARALFGLEGPAENMTVVGYDGARNVILAEGRERDLVVVGYDEHSGEVTVASKADAESGKVLVRATPEPRFSPTPEPE